MRRDLVLALYQAVHLFTGAVVFWTASNQFGLDFVNRNYVFLFLGLFIIAMVSMLIPSKNGGK